MAVVSIAIVMSFHLKHQSSDIERRVAVPLGLVFWVLALACLVLGVANYVKTVTRYSRRQALVQSGWKTQMVGATDTPSTLVLMSLQVFTIVATAIVAACILFLSTKSQQNR